MTTRKNPPAKPAKKTVAKPAPRATAKKGNASPAKTKSPASDSAAPKDDISNSTPSHNGTSAAPVVEVTTIAEVAPPIQPAPERVASPWRVSSYTVGPNIYGGDLDFVVDLRGEHLDAAPQFVGVSAEGISPEFGDVFAFRIIERTAEFVRIRVRRLDENGGSWGGNLVAQVLCVY